MLSRKKVVKDVNETLTGEGIGKLIKSAKKSVNKAVNKATKVAENQLKKEVTDITDGVKQNIKRAEKAGNMIAKSATREDGILHQVIEKVNDYAIPMAGQAIGTAVGTAVGTSVGNPAMGAVVGAKMGKAGGEIARKQLNQKTGYGTVAGVGKYKKNVNLDKVIDKYVPALKTGKGKVSKAMNSRNDVVRMIMNEKDMSLPQASKYVKENNLWTK